jgi:hypothetical protein
VLFDTVGGVGKETAALDVEAGTVAARSNTGGVYLNNQGTNLTIGSVGGVNGISTSGTGNINITGSGTLNVNQPITANGSGNILLSNLGGVNVNQPITAKGSGNIFLSNSGGVNLNNQLFTESGDIRISSPVSVLAGGNEITAKGGDITFDGVIAGSQLLTLNAGGTVQFNDVVRSLFGLDITARNVDAKSTLTVASGGLTIDASGTVKLNDTVTATNNGIVDIAAGSNIITRNITSAGGITLTSAGGTINIDNLNTSSTSSAGGDITLKSNTGAITTGNLNSSSTSSVGGDITLTSNTGAIILATSTLPLPLVSVAISLLRATHEQLLVAISTPQEQLMVETFKLTLAPKLQLDESALVAKLLGEATSALTHQMISKCPQLTPKGETGAAQWKSQPKDFSSYRHFPRC